MPRTLFEKIWEADVYKRQPQPRGDDRQKGRLAVARILEVMRQIGVEGHAVALGERMALAITDQHHRAELDQRGLAASRLVHRRVIGCAGRSAGGERVPGELRSLSRLPRGHDLEAVAAPWVAPALSPCRAHDRHGALLIQAQQLGERCV